MSTKTSFLPHRVVPSIMKQIGELSGGKQAVSGAVLRTAIISVMCMDFQVAEKDLAPGLRAMIADCKRAPGSIQELKYVERELYGALTRPC